MLSNPLSHGRLRRGGVLAIVLILVVWNVDYLWPSRRSEWTRLERLMNHGVRTDTAASTSSFDWASVRLRHEAEWPPEASSISEGTGTADGQRHFRVQHKFGTPSSREETIRAQRQAEVRELFVENWKSYKRFAWGRDALLPISGGARDQFSGWAATLVDSLDTLWIMGLRDEFDEAVAAVSTIDFGASTSPQINMFETNIRYLGGLMAAYDLSGRRVLLRKAVELGDLIYGGFNTPDGMPVDFIDFDAAKTGEGLNVESTVVSASPGTLSLELTHLSQLTGHDKYARAASRVTEVFYRGQNRTELPGMWPMWVSMKTRDVTSGGTFTLGASQDSLYEYLPKMHQLLSGSDDRYRVMSQTFLATVDQHFLFRPMLPDGDDILLPGNINMRDGKPVLDPETEHLACFVGGMFGLAGRLFDQAAHIDRGTKLTDGCVYAYRAFPTGMMPERIDTAPCLSRATCPWNEEVWVRERDARPEYKPHLPKGFTTAKDPRYLLRPEAIESVFYMYRITGEERLRDAAWDMFAAVRNGTRTQYANAAVLDVTLGVYPLPQEDYMESFWLAETLKYFYLVFSPPEVVSLDEYVLNTEAHPFRVPV